jgi:hypothetical protein
LICYLGHNGGRKDKNYFNINITCFVHIKDIFTLSSCVFSYTNVKSRLFYGPTIVVEVSSSEKFQLGSLMCSKSTKRTQVKNRLFYVKDLRQ